MLKENYIWQMLNYILPNKNVFLGWEWFGCLSLVDLLGDNSERLEFWEFLKMLGCAVPRIPLMSARHLWGGVTLNSSTVVGCASGHCPLQQGASQEKNSPGGNASYHSLFCVLWPQCWASHIPFGIGLYVEGKKRLCVIKHVGLEHSLCFIRNCQLNWSSISSWNGRIN